MLNFISNFGSSLNRDIQVAKSVTLIQMELLLLEF